MTGNITSLIRRDFYAQWCEKHMGVFTFISLIVVSPLAPAWKFFTPVFLLMVIQIYNNNTFHLEEKYRTEKYFASLPVRRKDIVLARYLEVVVLVAIHLVLAYSCNLIFKLTGLTKFQLPPGYFAVTLIVTSLLTSLSFPLYFKFGVTKAMSILTFAVMGVFYGLMFAAGKIPGLAENIRTSSLSYAFTTSLLLTGLSILLFVISIKISAGIYSKRDI